MIKRRIRLYSYHTFLVIPFVVLFLYGHNLSQSSLSMTYRTLLIGAVISVALFMMFYFLMKKNRLKAGVFTTLLLFGLFQYGVFYEMLEWLYYQGSWPFSNIHRYLIIFYLLVLGAGFVFIRRSKHDFIKINYFLNVLIGILLFFNIYNIFTGQSKAPDEKSQLNAERTGITFADSAARPDIYYIILDGYASAAVLEKFYHFSNRDFVSAIRQRGFEFSDSAFANYYYTSHSLASSLNMDYHTDLDNINQKLRDNKVFRIFKENGYQIHHLYSGYAVTGSFTDADSTVNISGPNEFEKSMLRHTILRLDDLIGIFAHQRLSSQFRQMYKMASVSGVPKFSFMHFVAPHPPYIFDREGKIRTGHRFTEHSWEPAELYVDQLIHVNNQVLSLTDTILKKNPRACIILQSDHGPWVSATSADEVFEARSRILYALRAPGVKPPQRTSSVNTFRHLISSLYQCSLPLLNDSAAGKTALYRDPILTKKIN